MMLLFFSLRLILATSQPSAQDSTITNIEIISSAMIEQTTAETVTGATTQ